MRKIYTCTLLLILSIILAACISEVKPVLKPAELDIPSRIANQQKSIEQGIAARQLTRDEAKPVQDKLNQIKEKYNRLKNAGTLTAKDSESLNRMLDQSSGMLFRIMQK